MEIALLVILFAVLTLFSKELGEKFKAIWDRPFWRHSLLIFFISLMAFSYQRFFMGLLTTLGVWFLHSVLILRGVIGEGVVGSLIAQVLVLFLFPTLMTLIVGVPLYYFRRKQLGYAVYVLWGSWLVLGTLFMVTSS